MGFYGNITNTARTQFSFDKIYPNRVTMDEACSTDGVYPGRYVLIEYDADLPLDSYNQSLYCVQFNNSNEYQMYHSIITHGIAPNLTFAGVNPNQLVKFIEGSDESGVEENQIVRILSGNKYTNVSVADKYIQIKDIGGNTYISASKQEFDKYWSDKGGYKYANIEFHEELYKTSSKGILKSDSRMESNFVVGEYLIIKAGHSYCKSDDDEFWIATKSPTGLLVWEEVGPEELNNYTRNFTTDIAKYKNSRGYDSTVWEKVYSNNEEKYVMIAELNSVVPTFDVVADAPSILPITPHFDANSNNVYYRLHWQPQWGFRTKAANNYIRGPRINEEGHSIDGVKVKMSIDSVQYPSDQETTWSGTFMDMTTDSLKRGFFNPGTETWDENIFSPVNKDSLSKETYDNNRGGLYFIKDKNNTMVVGPSTYNSNLTYYKKLENGEPLDAAIYYNKAGFNSSEITYSSDLIEKRSDNTPKYKSYNESIAANGWVDEDNISIKPTGQSGHVYSPHNGSLDMVAQPDTQELSVMLPSIGNTMAEIWDLVYGGRNTNNQIASSSIRNKDIQWENANQVVRRDGLRLIREDINNSGYEIVTKEGETLAGCINSIHDLMGMIIVNDTVNKDSQEYIDSLDPKKIYYNPADGTFNRKHKIFDYEELKYKYTSIKVVESNYSPGYYYKDEFGREIVSDTSFETVLASLKTNPDDNYVTLFYKNLAESNNEKLWEKVEVLPWNAGNYFKISEKNYEYCEDQKPEPGKQYYELNKDFQAVNFENTYEQNKYYIQEAPHNVEGLSYSGYKLCDDAYATVGQHYYEIDSTGVIEASHVLKNRNDLTTEGNLQDSVTEPYEYIYTPGIFYYEQHFDNDGQDVNALMIEKKSQEELQWDEEGYLITDKDYFIIHLATKEEDAGYGSVWVKNEQGDLIEQRVIIHYEKLLAKIPVRIKKRIDNLYFISNEIPANKETGEPEVVLNYTKVTDQILKAHYTLHCSTLSPLSMQSLFFQTYYSFTQDNCIEQGNFYTKDTFWYQPEGTKNWTIDQSDAPKPEAIYDFLITDNISSIIINGENYIIENDAIIYKGKVYEKDKHNIISIPLSRQYYKNVTFSKIEGTFYEPDSFYAENEEGEKVIVQDNGITSEILAYYKRNEIYVLEDTLNIYKKGSIWNSNLDQIPATVKLALRTDNWDLQELPEFARKLNTIHGLILRINEILEYGDEETRDPKTVQGTINRLNDILANFTKLTPRQFTAIDSYGRIHSTPWTTAQEFSTSNWQKSRSFETNYRNFKENRWIYTDINPNPKQPLITFKHQPISKVSNTTTKSDKNIPLTETYYGNNNDASDILKLETPIIDAAGHVVGKNEESVTLPFGFKILKAQNSLEDEVQWSQSAGGAHTTTSANESVKDIIADNTKDSLSISGGNKWIRFQTSGDGEDTNSISSGKDTKNTLTIAHETHDFITTPIAEKTNFNTQTGNAADEIIIPDWEYDIAGHITKKQNHTYILPFGFKTVNIANQSLATTDLVENTNSIVADKTQDVFTFETGNQWIKMAGNTDTDTFTIGHKVGIIKDADITDTTNQGYQVNLNTLSNLTETTKVSTFTVPDVKWDAAGHIISHSRHTYTLPNSYGTVSGDVGSTEASVAHANLEIKGDNWLLSTVTNDNVVTISHKAANQVTHSVVNNDTPGFGETFSIVDLDFDTTGHYYGNGTHSVKIPGISLTNDTTGNVITGITYSYDKTDNTGKFIENKEFLGSISLGLINNEKISAENLVLTTETSLSKALNILNTKIANEVLARENTDLRVEELENKSNPIFDSIAEELEEGENGIFVLQFVKQDGKIVPNWAKIEEWKKGDRKY